MTIEIAAYEITIALPTGVGVSTDLVVYPDEIEELVLAELDAWCRKPFILGRKIIDPRAFFFDMETTYRAFCMLWDAEIINQVHNMVRVSIHPTSYVAAYDRTTTTEDDH